MKIVLSIIALFLSFTAASICASSEDAMMISVRSETIQWVDAPPVFPAGAKMAILQGDMAKPGAFAFRIKLPDGYKIAPHFHPGDENITVLSGTFFLGEGDQFERSQAKELPAGSFAMMPKGHHHFAWAKGETTLQIHGIGPWGLTYVNPADDPSRKL